MLLGCEVSNSEISKRNREFIASRAHHMRTQESQTLHASGLLSCCCAGRLMRDFTTIVCCIIITCFVAIVLSTEVVGQDKEPAVTESEQADVVKPDATDSNQTSNKDQAKTQSDPVAEDSQQEADPVEPPVKNKTNPVEEKTGIPVVNLLEKGLAESWDYFSSDGTTQLSEAWFLKSVDEQQQLICQGTPKGFLYTKTQYSNFRLTFEWKYVTDPNSNSGVLIYTQKEPRLWPTAMQVQLHQPLAGCIFPGGDATSDSSTKLEGLAREIGEWNSCVIVSEGGKLSVEINGHKAGEVSGCKPSTGFIALQAEGSETHFRKLMLQVLPPPEATPAVTVEAPTPVVPPKELPKEATPTEPAVVRPEKTKPQNTKLKNTDSE